MRCRAPASSTRVQRDFCGHAILPAINRRLAGGLRNATTAARRATRKRRPPMVDAELPEQLLCYLLDGTGSELVLNKLSTTPGVGDALQFNNPVRHALRDEENARSRFFQTVNCEDAQFFVRLGKMYAAALMLP